MNSNKISCEKYVFEQNQYNSSPILELSVKFASQICHENINKSLDGAYLADFGIDITFAVAPYDSKERKGGAKTIPFSTLYAKIFFSPLLFVPSFV